MLKRILAITLDSATATTDASNQLPVVFLPELAQVCVVLGLFVCRLKLRTCSSCIMHTRGSSVPRVLGYICMRNVSQHATLHPFLPPTHTHAHIYSAGAAVWSPDS